LRKSHLFRQDTKSRILTQKLKFDDENLEIKLSDRKPKFDQKIENRPEICNLNFETSTANIKGNL